METTTETLIRRARDAWASVLVARMYFAGKRTRLHDLAVGDLIMRSPWDEVHKVTQVAEIGPFGSVEISTSSSDGPLIPISWIRRGTVRVVPTTKR